MVIYFLTWTWWVINIGTMANCAQSGWVASMIMEMIEYARKGNIMDIKENYYI
jgi:hypothetical protein